MKNDTDKKQDHEKAVPPARPGDAIPSVGGGKTRDGDITSVPNQDQIEDLSRPGQGVKPGDQVIRDR